MGIRLKKETGVKYTCVLMLLAAGLTIQLEFGNVSQASEKTGVDSSVYSAGGDVVEEIVVTARLKSSAESLVYERLDDGSVIDLLGAEMIGRIGDSTVAAALRRVSGLSLVSGKFIYVRGLGERYSSATLNGASIPSPDLSRNVIPLDIFPTAIIESLAVQKTYSVDKSAAFGGGSIDIRTKGLPGDLTYSIELGMGANSETSGKFLDYPGGSDDTLGTDDGTRALSSVIVQSIGRFSGALDSQSILSTLRKEGNSAATLAQARAINRDLALNLNRNISIEEKSYKPDWNIKGSIGNNFTLNNDLDVGILAGVGYKAAWRETSTIARNFRFPTEQFEQEEETTRSVNINGNLNLGAQFTEDHEIFTTSLFIRNTDDEVAVLDFFNENREKSDGLGFRDTHIKFEERELLVNQIGGNHILGEQTREYLSWLPLGLVPEQLEFTWQYSKARARTSIPNEVNASSETLTDVDSGEVFSSRIVSDSAALDYRFTKLEDKMTNYRCQFALPLQVASSEIELRAGFEHTRKGRTYRQSQFSLGALNVGDPDILLGSVGAVFSDEHIIDTKNDFVFNLAGANNQSYVAATMTDAVFGQVDWLWNDTWRVAVGLRWEDYRQTALDWNIYAFSKENPQISNDPEVLKHAIFQKNKLYPAVSVVYISDWLAETFQLRLGWSETVVRPDLREITDASYVDARTGFLTDGNPSVRPSNVENYDARAEWFFADGSNFTVSAFYKDLKNPIEFFESAASDTNRSREIINVQSGRIYGVEMEGVKDLSFLGEFWEDYFVQGNLLFQDTELVAGDEADAPTNDIRRLAGASDYVINFMLGYDSPNGSHASTLIYNIFGDRVYVAGRNGAPDAIEQPFHSIDATYSWYASETITLKAKVKNILNDRVSIEREGVETYSEKPGAAFELTFLWAF
ncbi:MAG: TonB-dependent receptor [Pseudomonadales bacterium]|nr:TonB-dependent receptor [Pseudomonadales bacterium]